MTTRKVVRIDEEKCDGCGVCVPSCAEGAIQIIDGKAKLVDEKFCDGLGACLGECPQDAITIEEREAEEFDEKAVESHLQSQKKEQGEQSAQAGMGGGHSHGHVACPSASVATFEKEKESGTGTKSQPAVSRLSHWPIQLCLTPPGAPFFKNADLLIAADCVPFAYANFHEDFLKDKTLVVGCPKLDDINFYVDRLTEIFNSSDIKSLTVVHMEVPCCSGIVWAAKEALKKADNEIPLTEVTISARDGKII